MGTHIVGTTDVSLLAGATLAAVGAIPPTVVAATVFATDIVLATHVAGTALLAVPAA
jgi:hypothetical protein